MVSSLGRLGKLTDALADSIGLVTIGRLAGSAGMGASIITLALDVRELGGLIPVRSASDSCKGGVMGCGNCAAGIGGGVGLCSA